MRVSGDVRDTHYRSFNAHYNLNIDALTLFKRAVEERLQRLCLLDSHSKRSLADAVLAALSWICRNRNDVRSCLLSSGVAAHAKSKTCGALFIVVVAHKHFLLML